MLERLNWSTDQFKESGIQSISLSRKQFKAEACESRVFAMKYRSLKTKY